MTTPSYDQWTGRTVHGTDGKIGTVDALYVDADGTEPTFMTVSTGMFGTKTSFVPAQEVTFEGDDIQVPYSKDQVKDAPGIEPDAELVPEEEERLYAHYGLGSGGASTGTTTGTATTGTGGMTDDRRDGETRDVDMTRDVDADRDVDRDGDARGTVGHDTSGPTTDDAMTRSEEELKVGTRSEETGRARLRKYIVSEDVETTVPVTREEVHVEREPITDANRGAATSGGNLTEEEHEVVLHEEHPVVQKEVVAKERIRLDKDVVRDEETVHDTVEKEVIDVAGVEETSDTDRR